VERKGGGGGGGGGQGNPHGGSTQFVDA